MPLYQLMKRTDHFIWSQRANDAFNDLKPTLSTTPILAAPAPREPMLLYVAATPWVISVVIVVEHTEEGKELLVQHPVYYLSEVLTLSKQHYPHYQKVAYGVYMAAKKLKHYFEEHPITVVSTTPLSEIIGCKDATGKVAKWAIELAAHTIQYKPRTTIKSQIIANFFADWGEHQYLPPAPDSTYWRMNFDGSKMLGGLGAGVVLTSPKGDKLQYVLQMHFRALNSRGVRGPGAWAQASQGDWHPEDPLLRRLRPGGASSLWGMGRQGCQHGFLPLLRAAALRILQGLRVSSRP
jgi:hypothetical protein